MSEADVPPPPTDDQEPLPSAEDVEDSNAEQTEEVQDEPQQFEEVQDANDNDEPPAQLVDDQAATEEQGEKAIENEVEQVGDDEERVARTADTETSDLRELREIPEDQGPESRSTPTSNPDSFVAPTGIRAESSQSSDFGFDETLQRSAITHISRKSNGAIAEERNDDEERPSTHPQVHFPNFRNFMPKHSYGRAAARSPLVGVHCSSQRY
jgi:hypothetical protein